MSWLSRAVRGAIGWYSMKTSLKTIGALTNATEQISQTSATGATVILPTPEEIEMVTKTSPVLTAAEPTWPLYQLTPLEFEFCQKAYQMGGAAWMAAYPHPHDDSPAEQVELGKVCQALESLVRCGLAVDISSATPYKEAVAEALGHGRTVRYFAFSVKGWMLFSADDQKWSPL